MKVKELRSCLAAFDDDMELFAAPEVRMDFIGRDVDIDVPHPLDQYKLKKLHIVGQVDQKTGEVQERRIVLSFDQPEHPAETISDELRTKFIKFREAYLIAHSDLTKSGADCKLATVGAWDAARLAVPLTNDELRLYNILHVIVHSVKGGEALVNLDRINK